jgi:hypothetical protein
MSIRNTLIVLASVLTLGTAAAAGLKDKPPKDVKLGGDWRLDPYRSDEPAAVIDEAVQEAKKKQEREERGDRSADDHGVFDKPWGGGEPSGTPDRPDPRGPFPDGGTWRRDKGGGGSTRVDPTGGESSASWGTGRSTPRNEFLPSLQKNPESLAIRDSGKSITVTEDGIDTACAAGDTVPVADSYGDGQRRCGWSGKAWVVETTRGKRFKRTDRFELTNKGTILLYITSANGKEMPDVRISRTYTVAPAAPAASP